ncbi:putative fucosyltransferase 7 [Hordeum vulgare]|nr:putative fucosyltransferase 7 [Hordeum vulgare]
MEGLVDDAAAVEGPAVHVLEQDLQLPAALAHVVAAHHLWVLPRDLAPHRVVVVLSYRGLGTVDGCSYLVLLSYRGLDNRILAMSPAFHYAMLTDRVLLVDRGKTMGDLFCEPFRGRSDHGEGRLSVLPRQRPMAQARSIKIGTCFFSSDGCRRTLRTYTNQLRLMHLCLASEHEQTAQNTSLENKLAYCDDHRQFLHRVQLVIMRTDSYIAPSLFLNPAYQQELDRMFPRKDSVFYIISCYLLHPTNGVWGMVTRFYNSYLKNTDERMGIQIRVFVQDDKPVQHILD